MTDYRGIPMPEDIGANIAFKALWEKGVDQALDSVLEAAESIAKDMEYGSGAFFPSEWLEGRDAGQESAAESIRDMMSTYKKG